MLFIFSMVKLDLMMDRKDTHEFLIAFVWPFPKGDLIILIILSEISRMGYANPGLRNPDPPILVVISHFPQGADRGPKFNKQWPWTWVHRYILGPWKVTFRIGK